MESISKITLYPIEIPFRKSADISSRKYPFLTSVLVRVQTDGGAIGFGEAIPDFAFTGESMETVVSAIKNYLEPAAIGLSPFSLGDLNYKMDCALVMNMSAKAAIDMACFDLVGRITEQPVYQLLGGGFRYEIIQVPEIVFGPLEEVLMNCEDAVAQGVRCLKVKVGESPEKDVEKIKQIRESVGEDVELRLDANQGWGDYWTALQIVRKIERYKVALIEQPLPSNDLRGTAMLRRAMEIPIMLDESVNTISDAMRAIELEACDIISVKIMKAGGLWRTRQLIDLCAAHGVPCHMGTMWETEIGWAANLHLIASLRGIRLWDAYPPSAIYWGPEASVATPIISNLHNGVRMVEVPKGPGLGVRLKEDTVQNYLKRGM